MTAIPGGFVRAGERFTDVSTGIRVAVLTSVFLLVSLGLVLGFGLEAGSSWTHTGGVDVPR